MGEAKRRAQGAPSAKAPEPELEAPERRLFRGIVKLQRPLSDRGAPFLAHPAGRERRWMLKPTTAVRALLGQAPKGYFLAEETAAGDLEIGDRVPDQSW